MSVPAVQCKATSKQTGKRCKNWAIKAGKFVESTAAELQR
jgi:hypothetical protein